MKSGTGGVGHGTQDTAASGAMAEQTLLAPGVVWRGAGFASRIDCQNPGEHSLKLGTPGLKYGRPLAFKARMSASYANLNKPSGQRWAEARPLTHNRHRLQAGWVSHNHLPFNGAWTQAAGSDSPPYLRLLV